MTLLEYMKIKTNCPNCNDSIYVVMRKNRYGKSLVADCDTCGWRKVSNQEELDLIQPEHPFFEALYGHDPIKEEKQMKKKKEKIKEGKKAKLEEKYYYKFKDPIQKHSRTIPKEDEKFIKKIVLGEEEIDG